MSEEICNTNPIPSSQWANVSKTLNKTRILSIHEIRAQQALGDSITGTCGEAIPIGLSHIKELPTGDGRWHAGGEMQM